MDIIHRNIDRLIYLEDNSDREAIEPMSEWKWKKLYSIVRDFGLGPWIVDGMRAYSDDFFLQPSPTLRDQLLAMGGEKDPSRLERYELEMERAKGTLHKLKPHSLHAYARDLINTVKNIEE
jgi:hypothetical protein